METEENQMISEETKKEDKQDHFSDEDPDDTFQVNVDLVKNRTTTSNFKLKIQITNEQIKTYQNRSHQNSKRNTRLSKKDFLENHKEENEKIKESNNIHSKKMTILKMIIQQQYLKIHQ